MTLNDVIAPSLRYFTESGSFRGALRVYVQVVEDTPKHSILQKCSRKNVVFRDISFMSILAGNRPQRER